MTLEVTATDHFCGAGGASIGLRAMGVHVTDAANHWAAACEVYNENNPDTRVHCADLSFTDPRRFPSTTLGWFSPECKTFSQAAPPPSARMPSLFDDTPDGAVERSRVSMTDVLRFAEFHRYELVIVENVVDIDRKYPVEWWFGEMEKLGYRYKVVSLNSMVCWPTPQSRDRWYACFWKKGNKAPDLDVRPRCWCSNCEGEVEGYQHWKRPSGRPMRTGKYRSQYLLLCSRCHEQALPYVWPALAALDLGLPCPRIGDRERPLAPATRRRIEVGYARYGHADVQAGSTHERPGYYRTWPWWHSLQVPSATPEVGGPSGTPDLGLIVPLDHGESGMAARPDSGPMRAQTGRAENAYFVVPMRTHNGPRRAAEPLAVFTTAHGGGQALLELPFLVDGGKGRVAARVVLEPGPSITAAGSHFVVTLRNHGELRPGREPTGSFTADGNHHGVVVRLNGDMDDAASMATPFDAPAGTLTSGWTQAVVPFLTHYYGNARPGSSSGREPIPTIPGRLHHGVVEPGPVDIDNCGFRMMEPHEVGAGQAFPGWYRVRGSKRNRVRMYGQAVSPPASSELSGRMVRSLA